MKLKYVPEDFVVNEIYDLDSYRKKEVEGKGGVYYFELWKRDYTTQRAIEHVVRAFRVRARDVHFSGTKDRVAVTRQIISVRRFRGDVERVVEFFNSKNDDIKINFLGEFPARINLGDNLGNEFRIVVRDLDESEIDFAKKRVEEARRFGVLNYFDSQRFGFSGMNSIIGKYFLRGDFKKAFFNILIAAPTNVREEHGRFIEYLKNNWDSIIENNDWSGALEVLPDWLRLERKMIEWVASHKNDFLGAMNLIHKKIRTMYVNSYQSYLFNETVKYLDSIGKINDYDFLPLVASETKLEGDWGDFILGLLGKDGLSLKDFDLPRSPTLKLKEVMRKVRIEVSEVEMVEVGDDEFFEGKRKCVLRFSLGPGSYATNVVRYLFGEIGLNIFK